jgi:phage major head subunit gpT-like protein
MTRSQFQRFLFPGIHKAMFDSYREKAEQFSQIFKVEGTEDEFVEDIQTSGIGLLQQTDENEEVPADRFFQGLSIRYDIIDYTIKVGFSHQAMRGLKVKIFNDRGREIGFSARQTAEVLHAAMFDNGFTVNGYDNVPLFSANHPLSARTGGVNGQVQSNVLATAATLSVASYRDMLTLSRLFFDQTGVRRIQLTMANLVVTPQNEFVGKEIVKSAGRPDTANRADNVSKDATGIIVWDYLQNAKYWYMVAEKAQHELNSFWREKLTSKSYYEDNTDSNWVKAREAFTFGYSDYVGVLGTNPT